MKKHPRFLAGLISAAMLVTSFPAIASAKAPGDNDYYDKDSLQYFPITLFDYEQDSSRASSSNFLFGRTSSGNKINDYDSRHNTTPVTGIASPTLTSEGTFTLANGVTMTDGGQPFSSGGVTYMLPFIDRGNGYYEFNSSQGFVSINDCYPGTNEMKYCNKTVSGQAFMPFNSIDISNRGNSISGTEDFYFGMTCEIEFVMPFDGKVNGEDMIFNFNGDDDIWVYVDDQLVLDIGGVHQPVSGSINFATGTSTVTNGNTLTGINLSQNEKHSLKLFYLERGAGDSNCQIKFNLQTIQDVKHTINETHVYKDLDYGDVDSYPGYSGEFQKEYTLTPNPVNPKNGLTYVLQSITVNGQEYTGNEVFEDAEVVYTYTLERTKHKLDVNHVYTVYEGDDYETFNASDETQWFSIGTKDAVAKYTYANETYELVKVDVNGTTYVPGDADFADSYTLNASDNDQVVTFYYELHRVGHTVRVVHAYYDLDKEDPAKQLKTESNSYTYYTKPFTAEAVPTYDNMDYILADVKIYGVSQDPDLDSYTFENQDAEIVFIYVHKTPEYSIEEHYVYERKGVTTYSYHYDPEKRTVKGSGNSKSIPEYDGITYLPVKVEITDSTGTRTEDMKDNYTFFDNTVITYYYELDIKTYQVDIKHTYKNLITGDTNYVTDSKKYEDNITVKYVPTYDNTKYELVDVLYNGESIGAIESVDFVTENSEVEFIYELVSDKQLIVHHYYEREALTTDNYSRNPDPITFKRSKTSYPIYDYGNETYELVKVTKLNSNGEEDVVTNYDPEKGYTATEDTELFYYYKLVIPKYKVTVEHVYFNYDISTNPYYYANNSEYTLDSYTAKPIFTYDNTEYNLVEVWVNGKQVTNIKDSYTFEKEDATIKFIYEFESPKFNIYENWVYDRYDIINSRGVDQDTCFNFKGTYRSYSNPHYRDEEYELVRVVINDIDVGTTNSSYDLTVEDTFNNFVIITYYYELKIPVYTAEVIYIYNDEDGNEVSRNDNYKKNYNGKLTITGDPYANDPLVSVTVNGNTVTDEVVNVENEDVVVIYTYQPDKRYKVNTKHVYTRTEFETKTNEVNDDKITYTVKTGAETKPNYKYADETYTLVSITVDGNLITNFTDGVLTFEYGDHDIVYNYELKIPVYTAEVIYIYNDEDGKEVSRDNVFKKTYNGKLTINGDPDAKDPLVSVTVNGIPVITDDVVNVENEDVVVIYTYQPDKQYKVDTKHVYTRTEFETKTNEVNDDTITYTVKTGAETKPNYKYADETYTLVSITIDGSLITNFTDGVLTFEYGDHDIVYNYELKIPVYTAEVIYIYNDEDGKEVSRDNVFKKTYNGKLTINGDPDAKDPLVSVTVNGNTVTDEVVNVENEDVVVIYTYQPDKQYKVDVKHEYTRYGAETSNYQIIDDTIVYTKKDKASASPKFVYNNEEYTLVKIVVDGNEVADLNNSTLNFETGDHNVVYYYEYRPVVYKLIVNHVYDNKDTINGPENVRNEFKFETSCTYGPVATWDGITYTITGYKIGEDTFDPCDPDKQFIVEKENLEVTFYYEFETPKFNGKAIHTYKDLSANKTDSVTAFEDQFKFEAKFTLDPVTTHNGKSDYTLVKILVNGVEISKDSRNYICTEEFVVEYIYERKDKPTPPPTPDPEPDPTPDQPNLPQTGGAATATSIPVAFGSTLLALGGALIAFFKRRKRD